MDGIYACLAEAFAPYESQYPPLAYRDTVPAVNVLIERLETMIVFVASDADRRTIGTISASVVDDDEGHLRGMAVIPEWHGSRVAAELLDRALDALRAAGCSRATLDTTGFLERAILFYRANGFEPTGRTKDFFGIPLYEFSRSLSGTANARAQQPLA